MSINALSNIDDNDVLEVAQKFLNDHIDQHLSGDYEFLYIDLTAQANTRRRLNVKMSTACSAVAVFNSISVPEATVLDEIVLTAFRDSKKAFLDLLRNSGNNLSQVVNVGAQDMKKNPVLKSKHTIIIVIACVTLAAIGMSFLIQRRLKHNSDKRVKTYGQQYTAQMNHEDLIEAEFLEPQPLQISDDDQALERNMIRSQYEKVVMKRANEHLRQKDSISEPRSKTVSFGTDVHYGTNGIIAAEDEDDEEATISSIRFSTSAESSVSSLGGLNPISEYDEIAPDDEETGSPASPRQKKTAALPNPDDHIAHTPCAWRPSPITITAREVERPVASPSPVGTSLLSPQCGASLCADNNFQAASSEDIDEIETLTSPFAAAAASHVEIETEDIDETDETETLTSPFAAAAAFLVEIETSPPKAFLLKRNKKFALFKKRMASPQPNNVGSPYKKSVLVSPRNTTVRDEEQTEFEVMPVSEDNSGTTYTTFKTENKQSELTRQSELASPTDSPKQPDLENRNTEQDAINEAEREADRDGDTTPQGENSYFTSIFTRRY